MITTKYYIGRRIPIEITETQALQSGDYIKHYFDNDRLQMVESFLNSKMFSMDYYILPNEDENTLLQELSNRCRFVTFKDPKQPLGAYFTERERDYIDGEFNGKANLLYDHQGREICFQGIDIETETPIPEQTIKYFYDPDPEEFGATSIYYKIKYDENGDIVKPSYYVDNHEMHWKVYGFAGFVEYAGFPEEELKYYETPVFEPF